MASNYIGLPGSGIVDPTNVSNANYEYKQASLQTVTNAEAEIYRDVVAGLGIFLYEVRVIGVQSSEANAVFKRSFTVYKTVDALSILAIQSDYTFKTDSSWAVNIVNDGDVAIKVTGAISETVNWVFTLTKTMGA
jgi:hypothetical protein